MLALDHVNQYEYSIRIIHTFHRVSVSYQRRQATCHLWTVNSHHLQMPTDNFKKCRQQHSHCPGPPPLRLHLHLRLHRIRPLPLVRPHFDFPGQGKWLSVLRSCDFWAKLTEAYRPVASLYLLYTFCQHTHQQTWHQPVMTPCHATPRRSPVIQP